MRVTKCGLHWLPLDGEPRFDRCPNEATIEVRAPGARRNQMICSHHAGTLHEMFAVANGIAEEKSSEQTFV